MFEVLLTTANLSLPSLLCVSSLCLIGVDTVLYVMVGINTAVRMLDVGLEHSSGRAR
jgi:hypothetical protein